MNLLLEHVNQLFKQTDRVYRLYNPLLTNLEYEYGTLHEKRSNTVVASCFRSSKPTLVGLEASWKSSKLPKSTLHRNCYRFTSPQRLERSCSTAVEWTGLDGDVDHKPQIYIYIYTIYKI